MRANLRPGTIAASADSRCASHTLRETREPTQPNPAPSVTTATRTQIMSMNATRTASIPGEVRPIIVRPPASIPGEDARPGLEEQHHVRHRRRLPVGRQETAAGHNQPRHTNVCPWTQAHGHRQVDQNRASAQLPVREVLVTTQILEEVRVIPRHRDKPK